MTHHKCRAKRCVKDAPYMWAPPFLSTNDRQDCLPHRIPSDRERQKLAATPTSRMAIDQRASQLRCSHRVSHAGVHHECAGKTEQRGVTG